MVRQPFWRNSCLKKGTWSPDEDQKLIAYIMRYGIWNWNEMPKYAGLSRSGKSCRLRWMNYLRPNIKRGNFTREEEETIVRLQKILGNRWSEIAARLPQRTDNDIKNYWNTRLKKRMVENNSPLASESPTEINPGVESKQENSSYADSSIFLDTLLDLDSTIPTSDDFLEPTTCTFSPSEWNSDAVIDDIYTMVDNFVSSEKYWEIQSFLEMPLTVKALDNEDCQEMSPNSELWLHEPLYVSDSYYGPMDDFWVNPFI
ncbi:hypothetical protein DITRI_Ditri02bG0152300 [Diplodiscus trichospermus]